MKIYFTERKDEQGFYTDLAIERRRADSDISGVEYKSSECDGGVWDCVRIFSEEGARALGRPIGNYDTLNTGRMDLLDEDGILDAAEAVAKKLCERMDTLGAIPDRILVVGLGNRNLTPDAIGPKAAAYVKPTLHINRFDSDAFNRLECSEIAILCPGVTAESGMESGEIIGGVCEKTAPNAVIAIDAIATASTERLGSTVQISDTGLFPGSGVGNASCGLTEKSLGAPIISIGVPTVIDARVFGAKDAMLVLPKDIDEITSVAARIIGTAINQAFGICPFC